MQRHPADLANAWFDQARRDLDTAKTLIAAERYETACFLAQQAVEKALKAYLVWHRGDRPRTHEIERLLEEVAQEDPDVRRLDELAALDPYYVSTRYPDAAGGGVPGHKFFATEAQAAVGRAEDGLVWVRTRLPTREER